MRALGKVKYINDNLYELYEILSHEKYLFLEIRHEFLDFPGKYTVCEGDRFLSWYWVPILRQSPYS